MGKYTVVPEDRIETVVFINTANGGIHVLDEEEEKKLDTDNLPETIVKESAFWAKQSFGLANLIEEEAWKIDPVTSKNTFSYRDFSLARVKYLLKDWTLSKSDNSLVLNKIRNAKGIEILTGLTMQTIDSIIPQIMSRFMEKLREAQVQEQEIKN